MSTKPLKYEKHLAISQNPKIPKQEEARAPTSLVFNLFVVMSWC